MTVLQFIWILIDCINVCSEGNVRSGLPPLKFPPFGTVVNGRTISFIDMCWDLGSSIILVPVIAVLGNVAIAKAFGTYTWQNMCLKMLTL